MFVFSLAIGNRRDLLLRRSNNWPPVKPKLAKYEQKNVLWKYAANLTIPDDAPQPNVYRFSSQFLPTVSSICRSKHTPFHKAASSSHWTR